jgi:hypothetical protein
MYDGSRLADRVVDDVVHGRRLQRRLLSYARHLFDGPVFLDTIVPFLDRVETVLESLFLPEGPEQIEEIREEIEELRTELARTRTTVWGSVLTEYALEGQLSKASPAVAILGSSLHLAHLGDSSNTIWHSSTVDGDDWSENVPIPDQRSRATPALASFDGKLHMVHLGDSSNSIWHSVFDGNQWSENVPIPDQKSRATPALASFDGKLHMVHLGDTSNRIWHSVFDGNQWSENVALKASKSSPALVEFGDVLRCFHPGPASNKIWQGWVDVLSAALEPDAVRIR